MGFLLGKVLREGEKIDEPCLDEKSNCCAGGVLGAYSPLNGHLLANSVWLLFLLISD